MTGALTASAVTKSVVVESEVTYSRPGKMEASACSSTDIRSDAAFQQLPRPLQVQWIMNHECEFSLLSNVEQKEWARITFKQISDSLCAVCQYLEVKHDCYNLKAQKIDVLLSAFIDSEDFDLDDGRHAILVILQTIQEATEIGYHCRRLIEEEDHLNNYEDVEYNLYLVKTFYEATKNVLVSSISHTLAEKFLHLSKINSQLGLREDVIIAQEANTLEQMLPSERMNTHIVAPTVISEMRDTVNNYCQTSEHAPPMANVVEKVHDINNDNNNYHYGDTSGIKVDSCVVSKLNSNSESRNNLMEGKINNSNRKGTHIKTWFIALPNVMEHLHQDKVTYEYGLYQRHKHVHVIQRDRYTLITVV